MLEEVETLFADQPDLLTQFTYFLPDQHQAQAKARFEQTARKAELQNQHRAQEKTSRRQVLHPSFLPSLFSCFLPSFLPSLFCTVFDAVSSSIAVCPLCIVARCRTSACLSACSLRVEDITELCLSRSTPRILPRVCTHTPHVTCMHARHAPCCR